MILSILGEYSQVLDDDERDEDNWFDDDDLNNTDFTFKDKIDSWLRSAKTERKFSKGS